MANEQNLKPIRSKSKARKLGAKGGKKSGQVRREKKLISQMYAEFLAKEHDVVINGKKEKVSGQALVNNVITKVLSKGKSESVSMLKELREATEGSKLTVDNPSIDNLVKNGIKVMFEDSNNESADS